MKTVVLFGSPRKNGNTIKIVKTMTDTLKKKGHNDPHTPS
jgi:multimeric flavodoxin WrbA